MGYIYYHFSANQKTRLKKLKQLAKVIQFGGVYSNIWSENSRCKFYNKNLKFET